MKYSIKEQLRHLTKKLPYFGYFYNSYRNVFSATYNEDGLRVYKNVEFMKELDFINAYAIGLKQDSILKVPKWRAHAGFWAGHHAAKLDGDFVECGVNKGFLSAAIMDYIDFKSYTKKKFYLFDTFDGVPRERVPSGEKAAFWTEYADCYSFVVESFRDYENVEIVRGIIPDSLSFVNIEKVAYISIDMNYSVPERAALEHFWPKMVKSGIVLLDDYAFPGHEAQKQSADEFAESVGVRILTLPTGQGLIIKR